MNKSSPAPGEEARGTRVCTKIHTPVPGCGHRLSLGTAGWERGQTTQALCSSLWGTPATGGRVLRASYTPTPLSPSPRGRISAVEATSWGCSLQRSDLASSHFQGVPPPRHPCTTLQWPQMTDPGLKFPDQTRRPRAQADSPCVAMCQASCQVGQGSHSKAAG